ncbi:uncharacterized protein PSFLO_02175 [Pseudozyma flocculosa]|uniref:Uncharacterized protein n=1 Tax=Pseudozyma flocculosa TaxID=84751 RepID=A0A5C3EWT5_9BASI|nr:uncharacterized protein PSFLO_02175 [Pseudozyma flocculosa]
MEPASGRSRRERPSRTPKSWRWAVRWPRAVLAGLWRVHARQGSSKGTDTGRMLQGGPASHVVVVVAVVVVVETWQCRGRRQRCWNMGRCGSCATSWSSSGVSKVTWGAEVEARRPDAGAMAGFAAGQDGRPGRDGLEPGAVMLRIEAPLLPGMDQHGPAGRQPGPSPCLCIAAKRRFTVAPPTSRLRPPAHANGGGVEREKRGEKGRQ